MRPGRSRVYRGTRHGLGTAQVTRQDIGGNPVRPLAFRLDLRNHSPDGFEWGYAGSGPAQLALALLADAFNDDAVALRHYQTFKARVIAPLTSDDWRMTVGEIRDAVKSYDGVSIR